MSHFKAKDDSNLASILPLSANIKLFVLWDPIDIIKMSHFKAKDDSNLASIFSLSPILRENLHHNNISA